MQGSLVTIKRAIGYAILAALLYGISVPVSKLLLNHLSPYLISSLLYLGAGIGMSMVVGFTRTKADATLLQTYQRNDVKFIIMMILLDIVAPILLLVGLTLSNASSVSLLNNLEIVFTAIIASIFFKERVGKYLWLGIVFIVLSGVLLSFTGLNNWTFSIGSIFVVLACLSWGLENNCTRMLSHGNPLYVVILKGLGSGLGAFIITIALGEPIGPWFFILAAALLGFISYGMSLYFYISAQRTLGAANTSSLYSLAPFIGALVSFVWIGESLSTSFLIAFVCMLIGTFFVIKDMRVTKAPAN